MSDLEIWLLYSTFKTKDEAISAARTLLEKCLIACANIGGPALSLYRWQGKIEQEQEAVMLAKTSAGRVDDAVAALKMLHSYEMPCIVAYPANRGFLPYIAWVENETTGK